MNLASILNLTPAVPGVPVAPEAANTPATSLVGEFSALLGLAALPAVGEEPAIDAASTGKSLPDPHGNLLPEAAANDLLPGEPASMMALPSFLIITLPKQPEVPGPAASAEAAGQLLRTALPEALTAKQAPASLHPMPAETGGATPTPVAATTPAAAPAPAAPATSAAATAPAPAPAAPVPAQGLHIQFDLLPPAAPATQQARAPQAEAAAPTAQQLAAMPVVQSHDPRREPGERTAAILVAATTATSKEGEPAAAPAAPAAAAAPPVLTTAVAAPVIAPEAARSAQIEPPATSAPAARHDFEAVVERLSEARELARPGRATMQLAHREFGAVSVQFDMAGQSLKVGLASSDAAFAPAVQAALATQAERPIVAIGEAQASRSDQQRSDQPQPGTQSSAAHASQGDGQARDQQARQAQGRHPSDQVQRQSQDGGERGDNVAASGRARDGSLFA